MRHLTTESAWNAGYGIDSTGWGDRMLYFSHSDYQNADDDITYDGIGNPLSYFNGKNYSFAWKGRSLASATFEDNEVSYEYNSDGIRTSIYDAWGNFTISYHNSGASHRLNQ